MCGPRDSDTVGEGLYGERDTVGEGLCEQRDSNTVGEALCGRRDSNTIGEGGQRDSDTRRGLCGQRDSDTVGESVCGQRDSNSVGEGLCGQRDSNTVGEGLCGRDSNRVVEGLCGQRDSNTAGEEKVFNQVCTEKDLNESSFPIASCFELLWLGEIVTIFTTIAYSCPILLQPCWLFSSVVHGLPLLHPTPTPLQPHN